MADGYDEYECDDCGQVFDSRSALAQHDCED